MEINFEEFKKENKAAAEEFIEELELLPIFLNAFPSVKEDWLEEIGLPKSDVSIIKEVVDVYVKKKVELENQKLPQNREEVIKIEDQVLRDMFEGNILKMTDVREDIIRRHIAQKYPDSAIIGPKQVEMLEKLELFEEHKKRLPMSFIVFDAKANKIVGYEVVPK